MGTALELLKSGALVCGLVCGRPVQIDHYVSAVFVQSLLAW
jgi:hypothetical protein